MGAAEPEIDMSGRRGFRVGIDVGGTFTDVVAIGAAGDIHFTKVSSTPSDQSVGVINGIRKIMAEVGIDSDDLVQIVHGTTVATNALLEGKGARTALLTTEGFRDVLRIGRQDRPSLYDLRAQRTEPLVPRRLRVGVRERIDYTGAVLEDIDLDDLHAKIGQLTAQGVTAIAICLLHSYANPQHERRLVEEIGRIAPGMQLSVSSELLPEIREFERTSTTVVNAYVRPSMELYLNNLVNRLGEEAVGSPLLVMQSNGGIMSTRAASERAINTLLSGPAGGVLAAASLSEAVGGRNFITADVGGTSFDVAVVEGGRPTQRTEGVIGGFPVKFPHIDIHTIGAGGGSIAWIDQGGGLRVGPHSAGAQPGPVCYGRGGEEPTVCDAFAALGWIAPGGLLNGEMSIDVEAARAAIRTRIAEPLGLSPVAAAEGIVRVANAAMCGAIRVLTVERGQDPRRFTLLPYGGAGPLHAAAIARELGVGEVLVPIAPGNFSAFGLLAAHLRADESATFRGLAGAVDFDELGDAFAQLEDRARLRLETDGCRPETIHFERRVDFRYLGQAYELTVSYTPGADRAGAWRAAVDAFHELHESLYGFSRANSPVEIANLRVGAISNVGEVRAGRSLPMAVGAPQHKQTRSVCFNGEFLATPVYHRDALGAGSEISGPAVIEEKGSTFVMGPADRLEVDRWGNLLIAIAPSVSSQNS